MVVAWNPNVAVDTASTPSEMPNPPSQEGGSYLQHQGDGDLDSVVEIQGPIPQKNPFQEVNLFIGEFSRNFGLTPMASLARIQDMLQAIQQQTYHVGGGQALSLGQVIRNPPPIQ